MTSAQYASVQSWPERLKDGLPSGLFGQTESLSHMTDQRLAERNACHSTRKCVSDRTRMSRNSSLRIDSRCCTTGVPLHTRRVTSLGRLFTSRSTSWFTFRPRARQDRLHVHKPNFSQRVIMAQSNPDTLQVRGDQSVQGRILTVHYLRNDRQFQVILQTDDIV